MRGSGKKRILFPLWGFQWGSLGGGVSSSSSTRWGVWGVGGEGGWLFQRGVWARVLGGSMGGWGVGFHQQEHGVEGWGRGFLQSRGRTGFPGSRVGGVPTSKNGSFSSRGGGGGGGRGF